MIGEKRNLFNILLLSFSFMLIFTGFHTLSCIQALDSVHRSSGLVSLAIVYVVFGLFSWISPSLLCLLGPR